MRTGPGGGGGVHGARRPAVTRVSLGVAGAFPLPLPPISRTVTSWPRSSFRVALYSPRSFLDNCKRITCVGKTPPWREARHGQTRLLRGPRAPGPRRGPLGRRTHLGYQQLADAPLQVGEALGLVQNVVLQPLERCVLPGVCNLRDRDPASRT